MGGGDPTSLYTLLDRGGSLALFVVFLWGLIQGWWVLGTYHKEAVANLQAQLAEAIRQRDMWQDATMRASGLATQATGMAERYGRGGYGGQAPPQGYGQAPGGAPQMPPQGYGPQRPPTRRDDDPPQGTPP
jgi:hypothetical protein